MNSSVPRVDKDMCATVLNPSLEIKLVMRSMKHYLCKYGSRSKCSRKSTFKIGFFTSAMMNSDENNL